MANLSKFIFSLFFIALSILIAPLAIQTPLIKNTPSSTSRNKIFASHLIEEKDFKGKHKDFMGKNNKNLINNSFLSKENMSFQLAWEKNLNEGLHGASKSSALTDDSGLYVGSDDGYMRKFSFNGELIWAYRVADSFNGIHSTPALDSNSVYFGAYNGNLYRLDKSTGSPLWVVKLGDSIGSSPKIYNDTVVITVEMNAPNRNGYIVEVRRRDGKILTVFPNLGEQSHSTPAKTKNENLCLGDNNSAFSCFNKNSSLIFKYKTNGEIKSSPLYFKDSLFFTSWDANVYSISSKGVLNWKFKMDTWSQSSLTISESFNAIYTLDGKGTLYALNIKDGSLLWKKRLSSDEKKEQTLSTPVLLNGNTLVSVCFESSLCFLEPKNGELLTKVSNIGRITSIPHFYKNLLILTTNKSGLKVYKIQ